MRLKKLGAALAVVAVLGTVLAGSASAAATTTDVKWYTGTPATELTSPATLLSSLIGPSTTFSTTVSGVSVVIEATGVECIECKIENSGGTAVGSGKLKFTGVTVEAPTGCFVSSTITTAALKFKADYMISTTSYILFEPTAGSTAQFFSATFSGNTCLLDGVTIVPKGTLFGEGESTGVQGTDHSLDFSGSINSTAGGTLHVGTETASLLGTIDFSLSSGAEFGTH